MLSLLVLSFQLNSGNTREFTTYNLLLRTLTHPDKWKDVPRQFETVAFESFR